MSAPKIIGPYEIVDLLGRGGMGEVYKAVDTRMYRRPVALKLLSEAMGADPRALSRFDLEIETAANLRHPNIVQIYDRGEFEGRRYFAMELLEGRDLTALIKEYDSRPLDARLEIILQLCDALDYAHAQGVVHRDIKPANILVITRGGTDHVKLVDFGIAHVSRGDRTRTVVQPGTTLYMSPEQLKDEAVTPQSDLFSLGIVAYELCAGVHPFMARTEYLTSSNIMFEKQAPLGARVPDAPEGLEALFDRLLDKHAEGRPASAAEVASELKTLVRQFRALTSGSEPASFGNLDEMTGPMVERIVHWAKGKEAAGALVEALEAYKRAILLAPSVPWLHTRAARIEEQLKQSPVLDVPVRETVAGEHSSSRNRHREEFVRERIVEADAALDEGELDQASSIVAVVLRRYPDEPQALARMDRIVLFTDRGLTVKPYRQALRAAREALASGDVTSARRSREIAVAIWADDEEVTALGREIDDLGQAEMARALTICDDVLARAAAGTLEDDAAPPAVAKARESLRRAVEFGAPAPLVGSKNEVLDRVEREARERVDAKRAEANKLLDDVRRTLSSAERAAPADLRAALAAVARAEALGAGRQETEDLTARVGAAVRSLEDHIAREEATEREVAARLHAIRSGLGEVEILVAGHVDGLPQASELLKALDSDLASAATDHPTAPELPSLRTIAAALRERIATRRRTEDERVAREDRERRERERQERQAREANEKQERAERDKATARAEWLRSLLAEARTVFKGADDLAGSIETEADANALRPKLEKLSNAANKHAGDAVRLRQEAERRKRDDAAKREAERRAARRKWLATGGVAALVVAGAIGAWFAYDGWKGRERDTFAANDRARQERERIEAAGASTGFDRPVTPPQPPESKPEGADRAATLTRIRNDLKFAGDAPREPIERLDEALERAQAGIGLATELLNANPKDPEAPALLANLQQTRTMLEQRRKAVLRVTPSDLAATSIEKVDAKKPMPKAVATSPSPYPSPPVPELPERANQPNLEGTLVAKLFSDFQQAVRSRDLAAVRALFPDYPGADMFKDARAIEFELTEIRVADDSQSATATQSLKILPGAGSWQGPFKANFRYALRRKGGGFVIESQTKP